MAAAKTINVKRNPIFFAMDGKKVFKFAVRALNEAINEVMKSANLSEDDIKLVFPHQANLRILNAAADRSIFPRSKSLL